MVKDLDLFRETMAGVAPLKGRRQGHRLLKSAAPKAISGKARGRPPVGAREITRLPVKAVAIAPIIGQSFDRDVDRALSRGRRAPEAKLDLHGMTLSAAEKAVSRFLAEQSGQGRRVVLVVTGKGTRLEGGRVFGGRIRAEFPGWLERADIRTLIAGVRAAHPRHGGSGAFYVLLRRRSSASSRSLRATPQR